MQREYTFVARATILADTEEDARKQFINNSFDFAAQAEIEDTTYQGWSNYATWRINLEIVGDWIVDHLNNGAFERFAGIYELSDYLKEYCEELIESSVDASINKGSSLAVDYALAFLLEVNWYEIAQRLAELHPEIIGENSIAS